MTQQKLSMFNNLRSNFILILIIFSLFSLVYLSLTFFFNIVYFVVMLKESPGISELINLIFNNKTFIIENYSQKNFQSISIICNTVPDVRQNDLVPLSKPFSNISASLNILEPNFENTSKNLNETNSNFKLFCESLKQQYSQNSITIQQILKLLSIYFMFCGDGGAFTHIINFCLTITTPITTTPILPVLIDSSTQTDLVVIEHKNILLEQVPLVEKGSISNSPLMYASTQTVPVNFVGISANQNLIINSFITMLTTLTIQLFTISIKENIELENLISLKELPSIFGMFNDSNIISRLYELFQYKKTLINNMQNSSQIENNYIVESKSWEEKLSSISFIFCEQINNLIFSSFSTNIYDDALTNFISPILNDFINICRSSSLTSEKQFLLSVKVKYALMVIIKKCNSEFIDTVLKKDQIILELKSRLDKKIFLELHTLYISAQPFHIIVEKLNIAIQKLIKTEFNLLLAGNQQQLDIIINTCFIDQLKLLKAKATNPEVNEFLQNSQLKLVPMIKIYVQSLYLKNLEQLLPIVIQKEQMSNTFSQDFGEMKVN
jgi:hypothetical protein